jgi:DNA polymerase II small subunit
LLQPPQNKHKIRRLKMSTINETITTLAKKGFLLDRESLEFFAQLGDLAVAENALNYLASKTKSRIFSKKTLHENFEGLRMFFSDLSAEQKNLIDCFFRDVCTIKVIVGSGIPRPVQEIPDLYHPDLKILSSNVIPNKRIEVKDFVTHFKNRYNFFKDLLKDRKELDTLVSINKLGNNRNFSVIGLVSQKRVTKNKNIILEVEDLTGRVNILVSHDKEPLLKKAKEVVLDDVIGIKCSGGRELIYANDIVFADSFITEKKRSDEENYAIFISDIHLGSKLFFEENFLRFIKWINGEDVDEAMKEKVRKIKYLIVVGDNVDGVGIYPGQEPLLAIKDMKEQYKRLAELFRMIPSHIRIIMCPGQHDAVRVPEPQPALDEEFAKDLTEMKNVFLVSNPALIEIGCSEKKAGFKILMYHGASMIRNWIDEIEELRVSQAHMNPTKIVKYMLRHRHLSPTHSANVYVPNEKEDMTLIKEVPDIVATGDLHKADVDIYNNILLIACSCWQSTTPFEEKVGNHPDPCKVPMLNLKTREIKIMDFT